MYLHSYMILSLTQRIYSDLEQREICCLAVFCVRRREPTANEYTHGKPSYACCLLIDLDSSDTV